MKLVFRIFAVLAALFVLLAFGLEQWLAGVIHLLFNVFLGWSISAPRLYQAWHPSAESVLLFVLAIGVLIAGTHLFLRWLYASVAARPGQPAAEWRWRWTLGGGGIVFCTLLTIACMVLTTHQVYWLTKSSDPWFVGDSRIRFGVVLIQHEAMACATQYDWRTAETREAFEHGESRAGSGTAWEDYDLVWVPEDAVKLRAILLIPRRSPIARWARFSVIERGKNGNLLSMDSLPEVLSSYGLNAGVAAKAR